MADGRIPSEDSQYPHEGGKQDGGQYPHEGGKQDGDQDRAHRSIARLKVV
jgi:hypothetical protein